jgi:hypothetical protein
MYNRIIKEFSWPEIEDKFESHFDSRSGDGLTSVYYRVRKDWGMGKVLETKACSSSDRTKVEARATCFSNGFLEKLGYFDQADVSWSCEGAEACPNCVASNLTSEPS